MRIIGRNVCSAFIFLLGFMVGISTHVKGQSSNNYEDFQKQFKNDYFSVGTLLQTVGDYRPERRDGSRNGFSVGNARLQVKGEIDNSFGYQLQTNFIKSPALLDANMYYNFSPQFFVKAGLFKTPFSGEFLTGAAAIDFVNRSTVVNQLAPNRQIGLQLGGNFSENRLRYNIGVFNGNGFNTNQNSDEQFLFVGRLETRIPTERGSENKILFGVNASYEQKDRAAPSGNLRSTFRGQQVLAGSDIRIMHEGWMFSSEIIYSWLESSLNIRSNPFGYHATAGYYVTPKAQFLVRWDRFENDNLGFPNDSEKLLAGLNYFPSSFSEIQLNYIYPTDRDIKFSQILLNLQINL